MSGASLQKVSTAFKQWRSNRPHRARIPEELWDIAVEASKATNASQVAKAAGLDYYQANSSCKTGHIHNYRWKNFKKCYYSRWASNKWYWWRPRWAIYMEFFRS